MIFSRPLRSGIHKQMFHALGNMLLGAAIALTVALPSGAEKRMLRLGVLTPGMAFDPVFLGFREGLSRLGYREGKNIVFIVESTQGKSSDLAPKMEKLLAARPDMLYTVGTLHAVAARKATTAVPIVFAWVGDPVQARLIESYAAPNSNVTGVTTASDTLSGKRLEALLEAAPKVKRILAIVSPREYVARSSFRYLEETAGKLGVEVIRRDATTEEELRRVLRETPPGFVDAIYHIPSYLGSYIGLLIEKAKHDKIPLLVHEESMVEKGALISYGPDFHAVGVQSARLAAKILEGEEPREIPGEMPEKLQLIINLSTAKVIGLKIPRSVLERADRLVE